jgi:hypothetical protein
MHYLVVAGMGCAKPFVYNCHALLPAVFATNYASQSMQETPYLPMI